MDAPQTLDTSSKVKIQLLTTGVPGLDEVLNGGLPEYSLNLIAGSPGTGKTTLAHQIMFHLARDDVHALYFTAVGEPLLKMLRYQQQFEFFDHERINRSIFFVSLEESTLGGRLQDVLSRIAQEVSARKPAFVFVD